MTQDEFNALSVDQQIKELKAQAYDLLAQQQFIGQQINNINQEIARLSQQQPAQTEAQDGVNENPTE